MLVNFTFQVKVSIRSAIQTYSLAINNSVNYIIQYLVSGFACCIYYNTVNRPVQLIIKVLKFMIPFVPGAQGGTQTIDQQPPLACIHTILINKVTQHIIFILHDYITLLAIFNKQPGIP